MAKIEINLPDTFQFSTELDVLIQHINVANHLANEQLIALLNEARLRFMETLQPARLGINPKSFINADLAIIYKSEARRGDKLLIEIAAGDFSRYGCDFFYRVSQSSGGKLVAVAKTAMLMFDYENNRLQAAPDNFQALFGG